MITESQLQEKLTISALGAHLHNLPGDQVFCSGEDEFTVEFSSDVAGWQATNAIAAFLHAVFPKEHFQVDLRAIWIYKLDLVSPPEKILDLDTPAYAWVVMLLKMCDGIAAGSKTPVNVTVAQVEYFLRLARDFDRDFVSH